MPNSVLPIGTATWILESEHRTHGGVVIGGTGSGKTCLVTTLAHQVIDTAAGGVWYAAAVGREVPELAQRVDWGACGTDGCLEILRAAGGTVASHRPGTHHRLMVILDDADVLFRCSRAATEVAEYIARCGPQTGVALVVTTRSPLLDSFGSSSGLRDNLFDGNTVLLRSRTRWSGKVAGLDADLSRLPRFGAGYTRSPGQRHYSRFTWQPTGPAASGRHTAAAGTGEQHGGRA